MRYMREFERTSAILHSRIATLEAELFKDWSSSFKQHPSVIGIVMNGVCDCTFTSNLFSTGVNQGVLCDG
jgi:hypothetical protein